MNRLQRSLLIAALGAACMPMSGSPAQHPLAHLIELARRGSQTELLAEVQSILGPKGGTTVWGQDFLFVTQSPNETEVSIDENPPLRMLRIGSSDLWMRLEKMRTGVTHSVQYMAGGKPYGTRTDVPGYNPDSYPRDGVPRGKLGEKQTITSKIFNGMKADFWVYASPGVDPATPAPMMLWQDGQTIIRGDLSRLRLFTVTENLIAQKLIPPMVHVLVAPGFAPDGKAMRSIEYDTVSDRYNQFILQEVLPLVENSYKLRPDGYSRGTAGESSGGICAFNSAWFNPEKFTRVHSTIGTYESIQWIPDQKLDGGNVYPFAVRKESKRNIRVWLSDGADDLENEHGSWPLQNINMANSLKMREYDFRFRFGVASHNSSQAAIDLPESLAWLWRGYDPSKTEEQFTMDPAEKERPYYRVSITNRNAW